MNAWIAHASPRSLARIAGSLYLIIIVIGFFAIGYVPAVLIVPGDTVATAHNIMAHEQLYRWSVALHMIALPFNIPLAVIFYELFKVVNRRLSLLVVFFTLVGSAIEGSFVLNQFVPLTLLVGGHYASVFNPAQLQALAFLPLDSLATGYNIQQVIYAGYLLAAGYLVYRSTFIPRTVGVLVALGGLAYLIYSFSSFLAPGFAAHLFPYIQLPSLIGEGALMFWLLVFGVNMTRWEQWASSRANVVG